MSNASLTPIAPDVMAAWLARYRGDSVLFVQEVLGADPDEWQEAVLRAYDRRVRKISIRSCHGPGKTVVMSWMALHQILTRYPQKTIATAPTSAQLFDALAAEMKSWITRMPAAIQALVLVKTDRIELLADPNGSFISFRTSRAESPEAMQGVHSDNVLLLLDEDSAIPEPVHEAGVGSMSGEHATTVLGSNPTRTSGLFFDSHHRMRDEWVTIHVCADVPEASPTAYKSKRVSQAFIQDVEDRYGRDSNAFRVRVLGEFPRSDLDTLIAYELVDSARRRDVAVSPSALMVWGVDCARFGDDHSALCKRKGNHVVEPVLVRNGYDVMQLTGLIHHEWEATPILSRPVQIMVDSIGIGAGVVDRLRELGLPVTGINVTESPALGDTYANLRSELAGRALQWFQARDCWLPDDENLCAELVAIKYTFTSNNKLQLESKDVMRKQKRGSPDRADAFFLTFAGNYGIMQGGYAPGSPWNSPLKRGLKGVY